MKIKMFSLVFFFGNKKMNKLVKVLLLFTATIFTTTTTATTIITNEDNNNNPSAIVIPIDDEISLHQKLIKIKNSSKSNKPWILNYKTTRCSTFSEPNKSYLHILLLTEHQSKARPRNLELIIKDNNKNFNFNYYELSNKNVTAVMNHKMISINKCTPHDYLNELKQIEINLDEKPDTMYGNVLDDNDNTSKSRGKERKFPKLNPKKTFKLLTEDVISKKNNIFYIYISLTTLKEHFDYFSLIN